MKCSKCGSTQIERDDEYAYLECGNCGHTWGDQTTKNACRDIAAHEALYDPEA